MSPYASQMPFPAIMKISRVLALLASAPFVYFIGDYYIQRALAKKERTEQCNMWLCLHKQIVYKDCKKKSNQDCSEALRELKLCRELVGPSKYYDKIEE